MTARMCVRRRETQRILRPTTQGPFACVFRGARPEGRRVRANQAPCFKRVEAGEHFIIVESQSLGWCAAFLPRCSGGLNRPDVAASLFDASEN
jgi:hypothetical protein